MLSVVGLADADLQRLAGEAAAACGPGSVCQLANYLFPQVRARTSRDVVLRQAGMCLFASNTRVCSVLMIALHVYVRTHISV